MISYRSFDKYLAAPGPTSARDRQRSAALPPRRRDGLLSVASLRREFSRWLLDASHGRSQRGSFRGLLDAPSPAVTQQAPDVRFPLSHVRVLTRDEAAAVQADQLVADRCRSRSDLRPI